MVEHEFQIICSSDPNLGAQNVSSDGGKFTVTFDETLTVPAEAEACYVETESIKVWYTFLNIKAGINDKITVDSEVLTIPPGLYDPYGLQSALEIAYTDATGSALPFTIVGDNATQQILFVRKPDVNTDVTIVLDGQSPTDILGFNDGSYTLNTASPSARGQAQAAFNVINSLFLTSDICPGLNLNAKSRNIIMDIPLLAAPGSQVIYEPTRPPKVNASNLIGSRLNRFDLRLTDQNLEPIDTNGEIFQVRLRISWIMP